MEETSKYLANTKIALNELTTTVNQLDLAIADELDKKAQLTNNLDNIKEEIRNKACRIDSIIETLNGALK